MKKIYVFITIAILLATAALATVHDNEQTGQTTILNPEMSGYGSHRSLMIKQVVETVDHGDGAGIGFYLTTPMSMYQEDYFIDYWLADIYVDNVYCGLYKSCAKVSFNVNTENGAERALVIDGSTRTITVKQGWTLVIEQ